jgi:hypothetical protein
VHSRRHHLARNVVEETLLCATSAVGRVVGVSENVAMQEGDRGSTPPLGERIRDSKLSCLG